MREHSRDKERLEHILDAIKVIENGLGTLPELYKKSILLETEFWCKEYGLKF